MASSADIVRKMASSTSIVRYLITPYNQPITDYETIVITETNN